MFVESSKSAWLTRAFCDFNPPKRAKMPQWMQRNPILRLQSDALQAIPDLIEMVLASFVLGCGDQKPRKTWQDRVGLTPYTYRLVWQTVIAFKSFLHTCNFYISIILQCMFARVSPNPILKIHGKYIKHQDMLWRISRMTSSEGSESHLASWWCCCCCFCFCCRCCYCCSCCCQRSDNTWNHTNWIQLICM